MHYEKHRIRFVLVHEPITLDDPYFPYSCFGPLRIGWRNFPERLCLPASARIIPTVSRALLVPTLPQDPLQPLYAGLHIAELNLSLKRSQVCRDFLVPDYELVVDACFCNNPAMVKSDIQTAFFSSLADPYSFRTMFDQLPDVVFFIKDRQSRLVGGNKLLVERLGLRSEADVAGHLDDEFVPEKIAKAFRSDDEIVFESREPLINRMEVWFTESRELDSFQTTKVPLIGKNGEVVGLMGTTRPDLTRTTQKRENKREKELVSVTRYLEKNTDRIVTNAELASACGMSERTLNRKVHHAFGVTPYELMLRIRIQKAADALLQTSARVQDIALAHGFCDQSTFTQHFRKRTGKTPRQFRVGQHSTPSWV